MQLAHRKCAFGHVSGYGSDDLQKSVRDGGVGRRSIEQLDPKRVVSHLFAHGSYASAQTRRSVPVDRHAVFQCDAPKHLGARVLGNHAERLEHVQKVYYIYPRRRRGTFQKVNYYFDLNIPRLLSQLAEQL